MKVTKTTHKTNSRQAKAVRTTATRSKARNSKDAARRHAEKGDAHLLKAWQNIYETHNGLRKANPPSLKWLKSLMTRTSL